MQPTRIASDQDCIRPGLHRTRIASDQDCIRPGLHSTRIASDQDCIRPGLHSTRIASDQDCIRPGLHSTRIASDQDCIRPGLHFTRIASDQDCIRPGLHSTRIASNHAHNVFCQNAVASKTTVAVNHRHSQPFPIKPSPHARKGHEIIQVLSSMFLAFVKPLWVVHGFFRVQPSGKPSQVFTFGDCYKSSAPEG